MSLLNLIFPYFRKKPKELIELEKWLEDNATETDNVYNVPTEYKQLPLSFNNNQLGESKYYAKGDKPKVNVIDKNKTFDDSVDLLKLFQQKKFPKLGEIWFNQNSTKIQVVAHLKRGTSQHYQARNNKNRQSLMSRIKPLVSPDEVRLDRTHLIPIGYHGSESDNRLLVSWDAKQNQGVFNEFEQKMKNVKEDIFWITEISKQVYGLKWNYLVISSQNYKIIGKLEEYLGSSIKPVEYEWTNGYEEIEKIKNRKDLLEDTKDNFEKNYDPNIEKKYIVKTKAKTNLEVVVGVDGNNNPVKFDIGKAPHVLVAGGTGSGKSVGVNSWVQQIMAHNTPRQVQFIAIDPKFVEFSAYRNCPYFAINPETNMNNAIGLLAWICEKMDARYRALEFAGVKNDEEYNEKLATNPEWAIENGLLPMFKLVVIVDEYADLKDVAGEKIETYVKRLGQKARASGIHVVIATQRPSVDVISGVVKINFPARVCFSVPTAMNSRIILNDQEGGEKLLGRGDLYVLDTTNLSPDPVRAQSLYFDNDELESQLMWYKKHYPPVQHIDYKTEMVDLGLAEWSEGSEDLPLEKKTITLVQKKYTNRREPINRIGGTRGTNANVQRNKKQIQPNKY